MTAVLDELAGSGLVERRDLRSTYWLWLGAVASCPDTVDQLLGGTS